jgi:hypothetical protein
MCLPYEEVGTSRTASSILSEGLLSRSHCPLHERNRLSSLFAARDPLDGDLISVGRPATQSSTLGNNYDAAGAVYNDTSSDCSTGQCSLTSTAQANPWWLLDLGGVNVTYIKLFNRVAQYQRLSNLEFRLGNSQPAPAPGAMIETNRLCAVLPGTVPQNGQLQVRRYGC